MKKIKIIDAIGGHVHISKGKGKYFRTKDNVSPSGHSLLAQIDMTHSGIVTKNYGFYLPARMKAGASTFMKDYKKPVIIGHDELGDTKPVGRVVNAEYVDTSDFYKSQDSCLKQLFSFSDSSKDRETMLDFVQHVIREYDSRDAYKGLGHLRGTVKLTDADAIEGILNETYLTVSTSMVSDSAICSVCGTDWVVDGLCDHNRGQTYDDSVCVIIPGVMDYDHLGIINTPADPHAHDFTIISDNPTEKIILQIDKKDDLYKTQDRYDIAAQLFACNDKAIVSLSSETDVNLIEIKDNIQKMENAMKTIPQRIKDAMDVKVEVYRFSEGDVGSKEVTVREYMEKLDTEALQTMIVQIAKMIETEDSAKVSNEEVTKVVDKYFTDNHEVVKQTTKQITEKDAAHKGAEATPVVPPKKTSKKKKSKKMSDSFKLEDGEEITEVMITEETEAIVKVEDHALEEKEVAKLAELISLYKNEDALIRATFNWKDKTHKEIVANYKEWTDSQLDFAAAKSEELYAEMAKLLEKDSVLSEEDLGKLKASDFCGGKDVFPVIDEAHAKAALAVLARCKASDSIKRRILTSICRKAKRLGLDLTDSFDTSSKSCNNNDSISVEDAVKAFEKAKDKLVELGVEIPNLVSEGKTDQDTEIEILESQLEAANEDLDQLVEENSLLKTQLLEELATRTVDMKMLSGNFEISDRVEEIDSHKERTLDSLKDGLKDLETQFKIQDFVKNDGMKQAPKETIDDPTLQQQDSKSGSTNTEESDKEEKKYKLYQEYNSKVATYGKPEADRWLARVQRQNGSIPTID